MNDWIEITSFTHPHEAHLAKSLLEASEIDVVLKDEFTVQVHNFLSNAIGGVKIFVNKDKAQEALLLLEDAGYINRTDSATKAELETFSAKDKEFCPYCKSENIAKKKMPGYIFALSILFLGFPLPFLKKVYYCYDCSKEWKIK